MKKVIREEQIHIRALPSEKRQWPRVAKKARKLGQSIIQHVLEASKSYQPDWTTKMS